MMIKVLIVEDDPMVAEFNKRYLEMVEGFTVQAVANDVNKALEMIDEIEVDLVLLDVYLPGKSGFDFLTQIRQRERSIDVIMITAACDTKSINKALQFGAVDYLIKPFEFERLQEALQGYKEKANVMKRQKKLSQTDLDKLLLAKDKDHAHMLLDLPKGLTRTTLQLIWDHITERRGQAFSTEEMAHEVGISRVSMRKYLNFLSEIGVLKAEIMYGTVGRPVCKHRTVEDSSERMKQYM